MAHKNTLFIFLFLIFTTTYSQQRELSEFGKPSEEDFELKQYPQEPEASAVVIYESAKNYVAEVDNHIKLVKEVYAKIKVFDASTFEHATIQIPYYNKKNQNENVTKITAITHNGAAKTYLSDNAIFDTDETPKWAIKKFTFPNVKDGSILEYTYRIESDYFSNFQGWDFQGDLPKMYTELHTEIPGNFRYNRTLYGNLPLYINEAEIKKACFTIQGFDVDGDCEVATYAMKNVPSVKEENYMLSEENYIARMRYEIIEYRDFSDSNHVYARDWDDVDKKFRYDMGLGKQTNLTKYFKDNVPAKILEGKNNLDKAKAVYYYIQDKMNWDGKYRVQSEVDVKESFERQSGNSSEINLSLINALEAAGMDAKIVLISTRDYAQPTMQYPVITDFIYAMVLLDLDGEKYFLDATDKFTPFGVLPNRALSVQGRVMDFKKGSYWENIVPLTRNMHYVNMQLKANEMGSFEGTINEVSTGYISVEKRQKHRNFQLDEILKLKQSGNEHFEISNLKIENRKELDNPYKENYTITSTEDLKGDKVFLYPFLMNTYFQENPFKNKERNYPIDFGFPITNNYLISIDLNNQYEVVNMPENKMLKLPENDGDLSVVYAAEGNKVNIRLSVRLNNYSFAPEAHQTLKEYFTTLVKIQSEDPIELKSI